MEVRGIFGKDVIRVRAIKSSGRSAPGCRGPDSGGRGMGSGIEVGSVAVDGKDAALFVHGVDEVRGIPTRGLVRRASDFCNFSFRRVTSCSRDSENGVHSGEVQHMDGAR